MDADNVVLPAEPFDEAVGVPFPTKCPPCGGGRGGVPVIRPRYRCRRWCRLSFAFTREEAGSLDGEYKAEHPRQTSDAIGGTASRMGPRGLGLAAQRNKGLGLPYDSTAETPEQALKLRVSRDGLCPAMPRATRRWNLVMTTDRTDPS